MPLFIDPAHYEELRKDTPRTKVVLVERFQALVPDQQPFLDRLPAQYAVTPVRHLRGGRELAHPYPHAAMIAAFQATCEYSTYSVHFLRGVLQHQAAPLAAVSLSAVLADIPRLAITRGLRTSQRLRDAVTPGAACDSLKRLGLHRMADGCER